jgi:hypothetical protein
MNGFFLINYLGKPDHKGPKESGNFIAKELKFNAEQLKQFEALETAHHNNMKAIGEGTKTFKDELFQKITDTEINQELIDSLIISISEKERLKEKELFKRLRGIYELCDAKQKEHFSEIIKKARRFDNQGPEGPGNPHKRD